MTLRAGSSTAVFVVVAGVTLVLLGDAVIRGAWPTAARVAGVGALVIWAAWMLLVRPSIRVLPDRAVVINVGRVTELPWSRVIDIRRRLQVIFDLDDGQQVEAWGSPFVSRRPLGPSARPFDRDPALTLLRSRWASAGPAAVSPEAVVRRVDVTALLAGAAALTALVLSLAVTR